MLPVILLALLIHLNQAATAGLWFWASGLLLGMGLLMIPFLLGGMGAGDVKLMATIGALKGASFIFQVFLISAIAGGILSLLYLLYDRLKNGSWVGRKALQTVCIPYAVPIGAGTFFVYWMM